jgi:hypothetical protein
MQRMSHAMILPAFWIRILAMKNLQMAGAGSGRNHFDALQGRLVKTFVDSQPAGASVQP